MVSIDMPAGPSEVLVIADKLASHVHVAADLLSQVDDVSWIELCLRLLLSECKGEFVWSSEYRSCLL